MKNAYVIVVETGTQHSIVVPITVQKGCLLGLIAGDRVEGGGNGLVRRRGIELELLELV
jgi:hypothetical protein